MIVCGVDIGRNGGVAVLTNGALTYIRDMPNLSTAAGIKELAFLFAQYPDAIVSYEAVHAMPGQGVSSTFAFGRAKGIVEALATAYCKEAIAVSPQTWKKHYPSLKGLEKAEQKAEAVRLAEAFEPTAAFSRPKKRGKGTIQLDGRAEAYLLARRLYEERSKECT